RSLPPPETVNGEKDERPVLSDGTTDSATELVLPRGRLARRKKTARVHFLITEELKRASMQAVGPALQRKAGDSGERVSVFGRVVVADQLEFRNGVDGRVILPVILRAGSAQHAAIIIARIGKRPSTADVLFPGVTGHAG